MIQDKKKNSEDIKEMQQYLKDINLYDGDIDSIEGPKTKEAQKTFKVLKGDCRSFKTTFSLCAQI